MFGKVAARGGGGGEWVWKEASKDDTWDGWEIDWGDRWGDRWGDGEI